MSSVTSDAGSEVQFCLCKQCRRFWLERDGWLLSRRETVMVLRTWPFDDQVSTLEKAAK